RSRRCSPGCWTPFQHRRHVRRPDVVTAPVVEEEAAREAGWRDVAAVLLGRAGARLGRITAVIRPAAWQLMALAVVLWIAGWMLSWRVFTITGMAIAVVLAVCALFLIGR